MGLRDGSEKMALPSNAVTGTGKPKDRPILMGGGAMHPCDRGRGSRPRGDARGGIGLARIPWRTPNASFRLAGYLGSRPWFQDVPLLPGRSPGSPRGGCRDSPRPRTPPSNANVLPQDRRRHEPGGSAQPPSLGRRETGQPGGLSAKDFQQAKVFPKKILGGSNF
ncbi:MAG: hypothetical protein RLZZ165_1463 [Bacteroidota bacterium]